MSRVTDLNHVVPDQWVDGHLLARHIRELAAFGALPSGGLYRPLYADSWVAAVRQLGQWMEEAGLLVRQDAAGNLYGRLEGSEGGPAVATGSHVDTVMNGGRLDGAYGILAGLAAAAALKRRYGVPRRPIEVLATCEEEGSRFSVNFWGARAIAGLIQPGEAEAAHDARGVTIAAAMRSVGLDPGALPAAARSRRDLAAFLEVHIEQGGVLEHQGIPLGVVTSIAGTVHLSIGVKGQPNHAGTTPMALRADALAGAAAMVLAIEALTRALGAPAVATVGTLQVEPGQINVVPGAVRFTVDLRHADPGLHQEQVARVIAACRSIAAERRLELDVAVLREHPPTPMAPELVEMFQTAAAEIGIQTMPIVSGAGHDAQILASVCPAAMLFVPSIGGRSHCPEEDTALPDLVRGAEVLARTLKRLCYEAGDGRNSR